MYIPKDVVDQPLYVVCCIFNPVRFRSRYALYREFQKHVRESGAILLTVEAAVGERAFALEDHAPAGSGTAMPPSRLRQDYIKLRVSADNQEIWLKENMLNIGVQHLPPDWKYVAFVDADVFFARPDWVDETLHQLQHYEVVQMFSTAVDMDPQHEMLAVHKGFGYHHVRGMHTMSNVADAGYYADARKGGVVGYSHPGFAWAWRRGALDQVGGLMDRGVLGNSDHHMAWALVGRGRETIPSGIAKGYRDMVDQWQANAAALKQNVGYVPGTILHRWHGAKSKRGYISRWQILVDSGFDPQTDLKVDSRGLLALTGTKPELRDGIRAYFRSRDEDGIDTLDTDYRLPR